MPAEWAGSWRSGSGSLSREAAGGANRPHKPELGRVGVRLTLCCWPLPPSFRKHSSLACQDPAASKPSDLSLSASRTPPARCSPALLHSLVAEAIPGLFGVGLSGVGLSGVGWRLLREEMEVAAEEESENRCKRDNSTLLRLARGPKDQMCARSAPVKWANGVPPESGSSGESPASLRSLARSA